MATRVTYRLIYVCPDDSFVLPHVENGWVQVVSQEFVGGGAGKRFLLSVLTFEPVKDEDINAGDRVIE